MPKRTSALNNNRQENDMTNSDITANQDNIPIHISIEHATIKGHTIHLSAPIQLMGELKPADFLKEYPRNEGQPIQIGVDEAGRGPLLGCVTVAAALLPKAWSGLIEDEPLQGTALSILTDSKKLSEKKRDILYPLVKQHAVGYLVAEIPAAVIDQINILEATMLGMRLCCENLLIALVPYLSIGVSKNIPMPVAELLFDGNRCPRLDDAALTTVGLSLSAMDCQAWVKGDARHTSIAAASILAKVSRDQAMYDLDVQHPNYGIAKHKGYPTKAHLQAIESYGVLPEHRRSYAPIKLAINRQ